MRANQKTIGTCRIVILGLALVLMAALSGCAKKADEAAADRIVMVGSSMQAASVVYSDAGVLGLKAGAGAGEGSWILSFFDPESGVRVPLCTRVNCSHDSVDCDADFEAVDFAAVAEDSLYYVIGDGIQDKLIGRADISGSGRRTLHRLERAQIGCAGGCEDGYLFYAYYNHYDENGNLLEKDETGIFLMDLKTEKSWRIEMPENYTCKILKAGIDQDTLYYICSYSGVSTKDYGYEELQTSYEQLLQEQRLALWKYDIATGEKTCLWDKCVLETGGIQSLGYGWFFSDNFDGRGRLENLSTGKVYELDAVFTVNRFQGLMGEGAILSDDDRFSLWRFDTGELTPLGACGDGDGRLGINCVAGQWVYAFKYDNDGNRLGDFYMPREQFMKGEQAWKRIPSEYEAEMDELPVTEEPGTQEPESGAADYLWEIPMGKYADHPDELVVTWAVPSDISELFEVSIETLEAFNERLEEAGYPFRLRIVSYDTGDPQASEQTRSAEQILRALQHCGADIAALEPTSANERMAERAQAAGLMEPLDERLAGSRLYAAFPELCWESVRYQGNICFVPSERVQDEGLHLYINRRIAADLPAQYGGDLLGLGEYLSADAPLYYSITDFKFAEALGYIWDSQSGLLFAEDGRAVDPLEEETVAECLRSVNRWYHEGKIRIADPRKMNRSALLFLDTSLPEISRGDWQDYGSWKGYAVHRIGIAAGILASSERKDAAFTLLELLHTESDYGNLLVYGKQEVGDGERPEDLMMDWTPLVFGLDTGAKRRENEEKKQYYEENILPSPALYLDIPEEYGRTITEIERRYLIPKQTENGIDPATSILTCDDFDAMLQRFREELKGAMDAVLENR